MCVHVCIHRPLQMYPQIIILYVNQLDDVVNFTTVHPFNDNYFDDIKFNILVVA